MSSPIPTSAVGVQAQALLQRVTDDRERRCAALRAAAETQAERIVRSARAEARVSVRNAVTQERARMDFGMRQAGARADIEARRQERQKSRELLEQMWAAIGPTMEHRWREPALRRSWIEAVIRQAGMLLAGRPWLIEGGSDWTEQERNEIRIQALGRGANTVECSLDAAIPSGLKIRAGGVCVDGTVPGLLSQREAVEAAFLAEYLPVLAAGEGRPPSLPVRPTRAAMMSPANG